MASKMATGSGKTVVMAMLIAWLTRVPVADDVGDNDLERPDLFAKALRAPKSAVDPAGIMNPGVLLDPAVPR
jgi:hypothetical protein